MSMLESFDVCDACLMQLPNSFLTTEVGIVPHFFSIGETMVIHKVNFNVRLWLRKIVKGFSRRKLWN